MFARHIIKVDLWRSIESENFRANGPRGTLIGVVTPVMVEGNVVGYVPLQARRPLENNPVPGLPTTTFRTNLAGLEMRNPFDPCKSNTVLK